MVQSWWRLEGAALIQLLRWARCLCFDRIIVEGDNLYLMSSLAKDVIDDASEWRMLRRDIWYLGSMFLEIQFLHVKREGNQVAHALARHAWTIDSDVHWVEDIPEFMTKLVAADLIVH